VSTWRALLDAEHAGARDVEAYLRDPSVLTRLELGAFSSSSSLPGIVLRRFLLALDLPPVVLAPSRRLLPASRRERADSFLRRYAYWRGVRRSVRQPELWRGCSRGPVILMYHAVGGPTEAPSRYVVPQQRFGRQMAWLRRAGYHILGLSDLVRLRADHRVPAPRSVILTFDDGYADNWSVALPILRHHGFPATIFLVSGVLGQAAVWTSDPALRGRPLLTVEQVQALLAAGMDVGAHTKTHVALTEVRSADDLQREVRGSREDLERQLGRRVSLFAYPFGDFDDEVAEQVRGAGFDAACCSRSGINDPVVAPYELRRVEIRGTDSLLSFARAVWQGRRR
jgi:peptidoglycan/xylan/chitin deacetylase (PgdA/CDA1 family)